MKRLQLYYWYIGVPVILVALGVVIFFDAIMGTVRGNPHPQINYIIFLLIALGSYQMLAHVWRINREGNLFRQYRRMAQSGIPDEEVQTLLGDLSKKHDVVPLIQLIQGLRGTALNPVQHAAVESELERFAARQARRLMMAQFMGGLMVGMGLLGTFIGLLGALAEIGKLIGSFNLGAGMTDPLATISELVARLTAPMQAMGVAFSASLFGVLGSLIMGVLMVGVKGASTDLVSFVQSDTALLLEITPREEEKDEAESQLVKAMAQLAENSPLLRGLAVALDHSERRVRELLGGMGTLVSRVETSNHAASTLVEQLQRQAQQQDKLALAVVQIQKTQSLQEERQGQMVSAMERMTEHAGQHTQLLGTHLDRQNDRLDRHMREQHKLLTQQAEQHQRLIENLQQQWQLQALQNHQTAQEQWANWAEVQSTGLREMVAFLKATQQSMEQLGRERSVANDSHWQQQSRQQEQHQALLAVIESTSTKVCREVESRSEMLARVDAMLRENHFRNEQVVQLLSQTLQHVTRTAA